MLKRVRGARSRRAHSCEPFPAVDASSRSGGPRHAGRATYLCTYLRVRACVRVCGWSQGVEYLTKEKARLDKMLSSGSVHASKVEELSKKVSVLGAFGDEE